MKDTMKDMIKKNSKKRILVVRKFLVFSGVLALLSLFNSCKEDDKGAPVITIVAPHNGYFAAGGTDIPIEFTVTDNIDLEEIRVTIHKETHVGGHTLGIPTSSYENVLYNKTLSITTMYDKIEETFNDKYRVSLSPVAGAYHFTVIALDNDGNEVEVTHNITIK